MGPHVALLAWRYVVIIEYCFSNSLVYCKGKCSKEGPHVVMEIAVEPVEADRILYGLVTYTNLEL